MKQNGRALGLVAAGALCGFAWGWEKYAWLFSLAALVPLLWHLAGSRWSAGAVALAFYLAASRGLPFGIGIFFEASAPAWFGWAIWFVAGLLNALLWICLWHRDPQRRVWAMPAILALTAIPPLGIVGWSNPLTTAGIFYPGLGFIGLALLVGFMAAAMLRSWPAVVMFTGAAIIANVCAVEWPKPAPPWLASWSAQDTHFAKLQSAKIDFLGEGERVMHVMQLAAGMKPGRVVVLPETILPLQSKENTFTASMLADISNQLRAKGSTILAGTEIQEVGQDLKNALVVLGAGSNAALVQRVPVPIGMWQPWQAHTFAVDLLGSGIGQVADRKVAYSICYEQLLVFPVLLSMIHSPDLIVGAANDWWARGTSIPAIQNLALDAWGRLFSVPVFRAANI